VEPVIYGRLENPDLPDYLEELVTDEEEADESGDALDVSNGESGENLI
jgi:hypothetical protein